jgi:hypothetical protein
MGVQSKGVCSEGVHCAYVLSKCVHKHGFSSAVKILIFDAMKKYAFYFQLYVAVSVRRLRGYKIN